MFAVYVHMTFLFLAEAVFCHSQVPPSAIACIQQHWYTLPNHAMPCQPCLGLAWLGEVSERVHVWGKVLIGVCLGLAIRRRVCGKRCYTQTLLDMC